MPFNERMFVYFLLCRDGTYYTGVTNNIERRLAEHRAAEDPKAYTARRLPVKLVWLCSYDDPDEAIFMEGKFKKWSARKKRALIEERYEALPELSKKNFKIERVSISSDEQK
jgi:putative endonuclease